MKVDFVASRGSRQKVQGGLDGSGSVRMSRGAMGVSLKGGSGGSSSVASPGLSNW